MLEENDNYQYEDWLIKLLSQKPEIESAIIQPKRRVIKLNMADFNVYTNESIKNKWESDF